MHFQKTHDTVQKQSVLLKKSLDINGSLCCVNWCRILFVSLRGSLKCVLAPESERMAVAMCELNSLADMPLGFENVKVILDCMLSGGVKPCSVKLFETQRLLAYFQTG